MGFNKRRMKSERAVPAAKEAEMRRGLGPQIIEGAERLISAGSPHANAVLADDRRRYRSAVWHLWVRCPACRTINALDLRSIDRHPVAAVTSLIPSLSCRSCRPNAPFAELVRLSRTSIADEMWEEHKRRVLG
jgi:hypothetical protein